MPSSPCRGPPHRIASCQTWVAGLLVQVSDWLMSLRKVYEQPAGTLPPSIVFVAVDSRIVIGDEVPVISLLKVLVLLPKIPFVHQRHFDEVGGQAGRDDDLAGGRGAEVDAIDGGAVDDLVEDA